MGPAQANALVPFPSVPEVHPITPLLHQGSSNQTGTGDIRMSGGKNRHAQRGPELPCHAHIPAAGPH
eukprot:1157380-Pelagomonas_calceolata.AAC.4